MKHLLTCALLFAAAHMNAQTRPLAIHNHRPDCTVNVTVYATDASFGNGNPCDILTNSITLTPLSSVLFPTPADLAIPSGGPGFASMTAPMSILQLGATSTFIYTDFAYTFSCPECSSPSLKVMSNIYRPNCLGGTAHSDGDCAGVYAHVECPEWGYPPNIYDVFFD